MAVRLTTPVTIVTGFLGSGKTTLINRLLRETHGQRIAVIENEFGEVGVDAEFLAQTGEETVIQLANGCLCCTVRGDLAKALAELALRAQAGEFSFDRVLIETTGLADPGPVIQTFLAETAIEAHFHLDGVVALVDAAHAAEQVLRVEHRAQIAYADRLLMSKCDGLEDQALDHLADALAQLNPRAPWLRCDLHQAPIASLCDHLFDIRGFALDYVPPEEVRRATEGWGLLHQPQGQTRLAPLGLARHTQDVQACAWRSEQPLDLGLLNQCLDLAQQRYGTRLWRCKGVVQVAGVRQRLVLQGVMGTVQISAGVLWRPREPRLSTLVFIGQGLDRAWFQGCLDACRVSEGMRAPPNS